MTFTETKLKGCFIVELTPFSDHRGLFARTYASEEFEAHGLATNMVQSNLSLSYPKHTLRGMHFQVDGAEEDKLMRCSKGRIMDVAIDLRKKSDTYCQHVAVELTSENNLMLYVPRHFAHGFLTLEDDCEVFYQVSNYYTPDKERGVRWNDPVFGIDWPIDEPVLSEKDSVIPDYVK